VLKWERELEKAKSRINGTSSIHQTPTCVRNCGGVKRCTDHTLDRIGFKGEGSPEAFLLKKKTIEKGGR